ncbi:hypothetical protein FHX52_1001 [Humibacillus xanthopallidus]|uniref:Lumazine-binding protein n=1 Tax=Humibacillus xanthopallidus TaxID=412689 RepID=A0A543PUX8_9MICO|nr:hypothetical protein [Humibacillus xanthopallidus]TQN47882.1 hypothetical protein FHX52_1001 [Humibacillus xanthopallidus]
MRSRPNQVLGVVVGAVIALVLLVVWLSVTRSSTELPAGSPERTVQSYLAALSRNDGVEAARYLDPSSGCVAADLEQNALPEGLRVTLVDSTVTNGSGATGGSGPASARVTVLVSADENPLGGSGMSETHLFELTRPGQQWLISGTPWPLYACKGVSK